ncbi:MAG TPA: GMC family oxidoreductase [Thermoleophilaceae bacterium]
MSERFEVVVVGSGAGGGVVGGELAESGRNVLLLETGPHLTAAQFERWESKASHDMWFPIRLALPAGDPGPGPLALISARCVGGTTTINTKLALRATQRELDKWNAASGVQLTTDEMAPYYARVEEYLGVRRRVDWNWRQCVRTAAAGFEKLGYELEPVDAYTDENCSQCGSCLQGCPTNAGKGTLNTYIHRNWMAGRLELRADCFVDRVLISNEEATGVEYVDASGARHVVDADVVVVACGALGSPQLLMRSSVPNDWVGRNLGFHPAQFVFGLFDEPQDAHMVAPISSHFMDNAPDDKGGYIIEAVTVQDPIGFTVALCDENGPMWGEPLVEAAKKYRRWIGLLCLSNDDNNGRIEVDADGNESYWCDFQPHEIERQQAAWAFSKEVLEAAGASEILWSSFASTHVQGTCRMGADRSNSVVDSNGESHDVKRLYVGDSSVFPRTLSVNPSMTIMAMATRLARHLDANESGYLSGASQLVA